MKHTRAIDALGCTEVHRRVLHLLRHDFRVGGGYRFVFGPWGLEQPMTFFGRYIEVTPTRAWFGRMTKAAKTAPPRR